MRVDDDQGFEISPCQKPPEKEEEDKGDEEGGSRSDQAPESDHQADPMVVSTKLEKDDEESKNDLQLMKEFPVMPNNDASVALSS